MEYPRFSLHVTNEALIEYFSLTPDERYLLSQWRRDANTLGFSILLKSCQYLGYPPRRKKDTPDAIISYISGQLKLDAKLFNQYRWKDSVWKVHLSSIRKFTGFRPVNREDYQKLTIWLVDEAQHHPTRSRMYAAAIHRCRHLRVELPSEKKLLRLVNSAWKQYLSQTCQVIADRLEPIIRDKIEQCLEIDPQKKERYRWMKAKPGKIGIKTLLREIKRLRFVNEFDIKADVHLTGIPNDVLKLLRERAAPEDAYQMKRHRPEHRYALMAVLLHFRRIELTDNIIDIFLNLIRRIRNKADKNLEKDLIRSIKAVYKKKELLYKMAKASTENPYDTVEHVLFPIVGEEILYRIIEEYEGQDLSYDNTQTVERKKKYTRSYRRMVKPVLDTLVFRTTNPVRKPLLAGVDLVRKYMDKKHTYYPESEDVPIDLLSGVPDELWAQKDGHGTRVAKHYFELCVLQKLEKALRNKEVWVEGSYRYRNPDQDLPPDWSDNRIRYCDKHGIPDNPEDFLNPIREKLESSLKKANEFFSEKRDVYIYYPGKGDKGLFRIPRIVKGPEHPIIEEIKQKALGRWGILDLVDILLESDRQVNFTRFFYSTAQRQVLNAHEIRERLILSLLGRGTGLGLKRVHAAAKPSFSYEDLVYFNKRFVHIDSVREAIGALVNRILEVRSPEIWKSSSTCTSDGKYLGAWEQNLVAQWNPHYQECGVMSYFLVDGNSAGLHSQVRRGTEIAAMIRSLIQHDTEMMVEANCVDSHGQSELGFAFCRFLSVELLPWLKRMKYERLYLPDRGMKGDFPHLSGVLARPIRWYHAHEHYSDMARHVVAAKERTAPVDSLLRRFNRNNPANQTYKGFLEVGKALKTIHDCKFLTDSSYRHRIHKGRNIVESWNSAVDFICYGGKAEIQTNDPDIQELTVLCLHLLQNSLVLANTVMLERVLYDGDYLYKMDDVDLNAMTPLFTSNVNPYGDINLDIDKPSFLEVH
jgi:TnpA family transposase